MSTNEIKKNNFWAIIEEVIEISKNSQNCLEDILSKYPEKENIKMSALRDMFMNLSYSIAQLPISIEEVTTTVQTVVDSIKLSRQSIKHSIDSMVVKTTEQLSKVTNVTESATNSILDVTEKLIDNQNEIVEKLEILQNNMEEELKDKINEIVQFINQNQDHTFNIMEYLQFQDITTQQIQGILLVLSETEKKLMKVLAILTNLESEEESTIEVETKEELQTFDPDANFMSKENAQKLIDDLFD